MFTSTKLSAEETRRILEARRLPGRLTVAESAVLLGFESHEMPILVGAGLIKPLGKPAPNSPKFFAAAHVTQLSGDSSWLDRATSTIAKHWRIKNQSRTSKEHH